MIFCVEDDSNIRELVVYTLETTGFRACGFFEDGKEFSGRLWPWRRQGLCSWISCFPGKTGSRS